VSVEKKNTPEIEPQQEAGIKLSRFFCGTPEVQYLVLRRPRKCADETLPLYYKISCIVDKLSQNAFFATSIKLIDFSVQWFMSLEFPLVPYLSLTNFSNLVLQEEGLN